MCDFCDVLTSSNYEKKINWSARSVFADDNISEILGDDYLEDYSCFKMYGYNHEENIYVGVEYRQELSKNGREIVIISPFSETVQFNFCPICGKQISRTVKKFEEYSDYIISIEKSN